MTSLVTATVQVENNNKVTGHHDRLANGINVGTNYRLLSIDKVGYSSSFYIIRVVHKDVNIKLPS